MAIRPSTEEIRRFIAANVAKYPSDIARVCSEKFGVSRQAIHRHLRTMEVNGLLEGSGNTRSRRYALRKVSQMFQTYFVTEGFEEDVPWSADVKPLLEGIPENIMTICAYGFTEMLNNVIDHSQSKTVTITLARTAQDVDFRILDGGVGIFKKIKTDLNLNDEMEAIWELSKGKLTTDPKRHSGEGIFFTSRLFDHFSIMSGTLFFSHNQPNDDWLIENRHDDQHGTYLCMNINLDSTTTAKAMFDKFASEDNDYAFSKTHVPVKLLQYGTDNLISRSQAKRLLARFEKFQEVILDFSGVESVGQAFSDEVFRVFKNSHPEIRIVAINANEQVRQMMARAMSHDSTPATNRENC